MDEVHAMKKWAMSKVKWLYSDLEYIKTVKLSDSENVAGMWDEDWLYSKEYDVTVIACNTLNTPAFIFNWKTLSDVQLKMVKAEMKEMMNMMWGDDMMMEDHEWWMMMWDHEEKKDMMWKNNMMMNNHEEKKEEMDESLDNWIYTDYSTKKVANANWKIVLFFHADWCPTCRATEKDILSKDIPSDLTILKTNFDTESELKKKYWVVAQTTFVQIDNKGNLIKKWVWGRLNDIIEKTK